MTDLYYLIPIGMLAGTNAHALFGWRRAMIARDRFDRQVIAVRHDREVERSNLQSRLDRVISALAKAFRDLRDAEDKLQQIARQRSDTTRRGNLTKSANRKALVAQTTAKIQSETAAKPLDIAA